MGLFIDDGQQQTHEFEWRGQKCTVTFREMDPEGVSYLAMLLDGSSPHYNPHMAYMKGRDLVEKCIIAMTADGESKRPEECVSKMHIVPFMALMPVIMGNTPPQHEKRDEQRKN